MIDAPHADPHYPGNDQCLASFLLPYDELVSRFGPPHREMDARDQEPGPCEYWAFRFACGLVVFVVYPADLPPDPRGYVYANRQETDHILQHVPLADCLEWRLDRAEPAFFCERHGDVEQPTCPLDDRPGVETRASDGPTLDGVETRLYGTIRASCSKAELSRHFERAGWRARRCTSEDFEVEREFAALVIEASDPILIHGPVAEILENAPRIADVLRAAGTTFSLECYGADRATLLATLDG